MLPPPSQIIGGGPGPPWPPSSYAYDYMEGNRVLSRKIFTPHTTQIPLEFLSIIMLLHGFSTCNTMRPDSCTRPCFKLSIVVNQ